jgi:hypothetical protein
MSPCVHGTSPSDVEAGPTSLSVDDERRYLKTLHIDQALVG